MSPAEKALPPFLPALLTLCLGTAAELDPTRSLEPLVAASLPWQAESPGFWVLLHRPSCVGHGHPPHSTPKTAALGHSVPRLVFLQVQGRPVV